MGVESANLQYLSDPTGSDYFDDVLRGLSVREVDGQIGGYDYYAVVDEGCWIDLQVRSGGESSRLSISIRVALCNPPQLEAALCYLLERLFKFCGGRIANKDTRERFEVYDKEAWSKIWSAYLRKREKFREQYGDFEAAISGSEVYDYMREHQII
jgi:hypothetical protein